MRSHRFSAILALTLTVATSACGGGGAEESDTPDVPVQGGEALQVEAAPAMADSQATGTPGAAVSADSQ
jgi:hypothetical protein